MRWCRKFRTLPKNPIHTGFLRRSTMENKIEKDLLYQDEGIISRIRLWANIVSFIILTFSLIDFVWNSFSWYQQVYLSSYGTPSILILIGTFSVYVLKDLLAGVFYFLVLRGLAQLLNLGLDLFLQSETDEED
jgi:hypothetical protein